MKRRRTRRRMVLVALVSLSLVIVGSLLLIQARGFSLPSTSKSAPLNAGTVTEYSIPTPISEPVGIANGPDGNLWFTESYGNKIGKITTEGQIKEYP